MTNSTDVNIEKARVLFLCVHNSARSQMAEAFLQKYGGDRFEVESAGLEPGTLNPIVVEAMKEAAIDISQNNTDSVFDFFKEGRLYNYVITVCDESNAERCPVFPGLTKRLHWGFQDPSGFTGSHEEKLAHTRKVRDLIESRIINWLEELEQTR
jgi:arsenate reductase (thioredoxin)